MEKLAASCSENNDHARAVYILSWRMAASTEPVSAEQRLILQKSERVIPQEMIAGIMSKKSGHSVADMDAFVARAPKSQPLADSRPVAPADISTVQPEKVLVNTVASEVRFKPGVTAKLVDAPAGVTFQKENGMVTWTPPPFSRIPEVGVLFQLTHPDGTEESYVHTIRRR